MAFILEVFRESWHILMASAIYILFGLTISGMLRVYLNPDKVAHHLGRGRFRSVFKAALLGIPIPLCSCGVVPAALSLKKQGANNGATTAFLISTPESGVDSIAVTYALMDPIMTIARPVAAFFTATVAGILENTIGSKNQNPASLVDAGTEPCCGNHHHHEAPPGFMQKLMFGLKYALIEFWGDLAGWFLVGIVVAGVITSTIPDDIFARYFGSGLTAMLLMLALGIPLFICATASTPIAAALILKGVSPGAALVFLLAGPATNAASLTVLAGVMGIRAVVIYLSTIAVSAVTFGLIVDQIYSGFGLSARALVGQAAEIIPGWMELAGTIILLVLSLKPVLKSLRRRFGHKDRHHHDGHSHSAPADIPCGSASLSGST
jgi:uncharacterized protein